MGLFAIVVASGGIKSNQNVFGGNQFKLPEHEKQLNSFFSLQYFTLKCGLLTGQLLVPILRNDIGCFGSDDCYPLAFGLPAIFMLFSFLILLCGKSLYVHVPPTENMFVKVLACILVGSRLKLRETFLVTFFTSERNQTKIQQLPKNPESSLARLR